MSISAPHMMCCWPWGWWVWLVGNGLGPWSGGSPMPRNRLVNKNMITEFHCLVCLLVEREEADWIGWLQSHPLNHRTQWWTTLKAATQTQQSISSWAKVSHMAAVVTDTKVRNRASHSLMFLCFKYFCIVLNFKHFLNKRWWLLFLTVSLWASAVVQHFVTLGP